MKNWLKKAKQASTAIFNKLVFDTFYDRSLKLWTAMLKDTEGNQVGVAGYGKTKFAAKRDAENLFYSQTYFK
jgi:hypothetical protein